MAQEMILCAKTIDELRQAQAVVLPLAYGLSLEHTAKIIGRSVVWTCRLRNRFLAVISGELDSIILPHVNTDCMQLSLGEVGARHPQPRIIKVLDGAGWHASAALMPLQNRLLLSLPSYPPELNPAEHLWDELREKYFHNKTFNFIGALEEQLEMGLRALENDLPRVQSILAWDWIVNALTKYKWNEYSLLRQHEKSPFFAGFFLVRPTLRTSVNGGTTSALFLCKRHACGRQDRTS